MRLKRVYMVFEDSSYRWTMTNIVEISINENGVALRDSAGFWSFWDSCSMEVENIE